ncbi:MAG: type II toxin-antitoxin system RelE/ParE family toxin [Candidatus Omnitrophica bacterium]|nr:type II toxin-antitoxin system RelE/ParE family toxin [Candidatus Omnitrophota bacterium]
MNVIFLPIAQQELNQTIEFYEQQLTGLGVLFRNEILEAIDFIRLYPEGHQFLTRHTRKCPLRKFPYLILYGIIDNSVIISAVAHQHRHPRSYLHK